MPAKIDPFLAVAINQMAHQLTSEGRSVIHMELGQPSTGAPSAAIAAAQRVLANDPMGYWESTALKTRIARHYADSYGVEVAPQRLLLTCGASAALTLALVSSFDCGDRVALARPGYVAYRNVVRALHMEPVEIPCGAETRFQLTAEAVAALDPAPAGLIIASPANPTGTVIDPDELQAIAAVCRDRGIRIISDEIYHGLTYTGRARSILEFEPDALVINSYSKYYSMVGWRLGWLVVPAAHVDVARAFISNLFLTAPSLSQHAALAAMDSVEELEANVATYRHNRSLLLEALPSLGIDAIAPPDGAFYIYASVAHLTDDSLSFCKALLQETGVAIAPGLDFDPALGHQFIRMSFAVSTAEIKTALDRMRPWFAAWPQRAASAA